MKAIILCIFALFLVNVTKAQSTTASLNITLTDIQSVTFNTLASSDIVPANQGKSQNGTLQVLSHSTSQIKKISSKNSEYDKLYKEFYSGAAAAASGSSQKGSYRVAVNNTPSSRTKTLNTSNLIIYQIDPR